jgi:hypothetical protein
MVNQAEGMQISVIVGEEADERALATLEFGGSEKGTQRKIDNLKTDSQTL